MSYVPKTLQMTIHKLYQMAVIYARMFRSKSLSIHIKFGIFGTQTYVPSGNPVRRLCSDSKVVESCRAINMIKFLAWK
jgi:hypothetical protein